MHVETDVMNSSANYQFIPLMTSEEMTFKFVFANLVFRLPCQQIKFKDFDKNDMFGGGLLKEHL